MALNSKEADHIRNLTASHNDLMARVEHLEKVVLALYKMLPQFVKNRMKIDELVPRNVGPNHPLNITRIDSTPENITVAWDTKIHGTQPGMIDRPVRSLTVEMEENEDYG